MSEASVRSSLKDEVTAIADELERAYRHGGAHMLILPALRPALGGIPEGCLIVSRGPWSLQRSLLWLLLETCPRYAIGPVQVQIDDEREGAGNQDAGPPPQAPTEETSEESIAIELAIHPHALRDLVRHAIARMARIDVDDLRHGNIKDAGWAPIALATGILSEHPVSVCPGPPETVVIRWANGFVTWRLLLTDAPDPESGAADVVVHVTLGDRRIELDVLDGRSDPPALVCARIIDGVLHGGPEDPDDACAIDDQHRRQEEAAAARAWKDDVEDDESGDVTLWLPPPTDGER
jgi:hypothetical protein